MTDNPNHLPDGTFAPGNTANADGENGPRRYGQPWKVRVANLEKKYDTLDKLLDLFEKNPETGKIEPSAEFRAMNPLDTGILWMLIGQNIGEDKLKHHEAFWDRRDGKATQSLEFSGPNGGPIDHADVTAARDLLLRGAVSTAAPAGATGADGDAQTPPAGKPPV